MQAKLTRTMSLRVRGIRSLFTAVRCPVPFLASDPVQPFRGFISKAGLTVLPQAFGSITFTCHASVSLLIKYQGGSRESFTFLPAPPRWLCEPFKAI